jgi:hypothetical protein
MQCLVGAENTAAGERSPGRWNEFSESTTQPTRWIGLHDFERPPRVSRYAFV